MNQALPSLPGGALTITLTVPLNRKPYEIMLIVPLKCNFVLHTWHLLRSEGLGSKYPVNSWELVRAQQVSGTFSRAFQPSFSSRDRMLSCDRISSRDRMLSCDRISSRDGIPSLDQVDKL